MIKPWGKFPTCLFAFEIICDPCGIKTVGPGVQVQDGAHDEVLTETEVQVLVRLVSVSRSRPELAELLGVKSGRSGNLKKAMERLRNLGLAELTIPDKPRSRNQKMRITEKGKAWLARLPK